LGVGVVLFSNIFVCRTWS